MDMPIMKKKRTVASQAAARGPLPELPEGVLDELVKGPMTPTEVQDLMLAFNKAIIERAMPMPAWGALCILAGVLALAGFLFWAFVG